jgi:hypothetical protein
MAASLLSMLLVGCTETPSCPAVCERATLTSRLLSGQVTFATGDEPAETRALSHDELGSAAPGGCTVGYLQAEVFPNEFVNGVGPTINCDLGTGTLWLSLHALGDPRALTVGRRTLTPSRDTTVIEFRRASCLDRGTGGLFTVDVTNAIGGAAAYPTLVTGDYARDFSLHMEAVADTTIAGACGATTAVLDLSLAQTAADAVFNPMASCGCE